MMPNPDDALIDAHVHVVPPGLPGLHAFPTVLDEAVATVAAAVRAELAASGTTQALAMGELSDDPDDPLGVAATLWIADQVPGLHAIGVVDPRRSDPEHLDRVEHQLRQGRIKGLKAYLGYLHHGPASPGYRRIIGWLPATKSRSSSTAGTPTRRRPSLSTPIRC